MGNVIVGRATLKMLRRKSKTQFVKQERNMQNAMTLLNYLKRIALQKFCVERKFSLKIFKAILCADKFSIPQDLNSYPQIWREGYNHYTIRTY